MDIYKSWYGPAFIYIKLLSSDEKVVYRLWLVQRFKDSQTMKKEFIGRWTEGSFLVTEFMYRREENWRLYAKRIEEISGEERTNGSPVLILMHGGGPDHHSLIPLAKQLARFNTVVLPDIRGYGRSVVKIRHCIRGRNMLLMLSRLWRIWVHRLQLWVARVLVQPSPCVLRWPTRIVFMPLC